MNELHNIFNWWQSLPGVYQLPLGFFGCLLGLGLLINILEAICQGALHLYNRVANKFGPKPMAPSEWGTSSYLGKVVFLTIDGEERQFDVLAYLGSYTEEGDDRRYLIQRSGCRGFHSHGVLIAGCAEYRGQASVLWLDEAFKGEGQPRQTVTGIATFRSPTE
jgi:hypothetical protein